MGFLNKLKTGIQKSVAQKEKSINPAINVSQATPTEKQTKSCPTANHSETTNVYLTDSNQFITQSKLLLIRQLPVFGGNTNESFTVFFHEFQAKTKHLNDKFKLQMLLLRIYGNATTTIDKLITSNPKITWSDAITAFKHQYLETNIKPTHHTTDQQQLCHGSNSMLFQAISSDRYEDLQAYAKAVKKSVNKAYPNNKGYNKDSREILMIQHFINGTSISIQNILQNEINLFKTLDDVLHRTTKMQQHQNTAKSAERDL